MSNPKSNITNRTARPQTVAAAMGGLLRIFGVRAGDADLVANWRTIVGDEIAAATQIAAVRKNRDGKFNIALRPVNPAMTLALSYRVSEITQRVNKYYGYDAVGKISFRK